MSSDSLMHGPFTGLLTSFDEEVVEGVIRCVLKARRRLPAGERKALNQAIDQGAIRSGRVHGGFRSASAAPDRVLLPVLKRGIVAVGDEPLGRAILQAWTADQAGLAEKVHARLARDEVPLREAALEQAWRTEWDLEEWRPLRDAIAAEAEVEAEQAALMLCWASGRMPPNAAGAQTEAPARVPGRLGKWLDELRSMPATSRQFERVEEFTRAVLQIAEAKRIERDGVALRKMKQDLEELLQEYAEELDYLEAEFVPWPGSTTARDLGDAELLVDVLRDHLRRYRPLLERGASRREEVERAVKRGEFEAHILRDVDWWKELVESSASPAETMEEVPGPLDERLAEAEVVAQQAAQEAKALAEERDRLQAQCEKLRADNDTLRLDRERLDETISTLRTELHGSEMVRESLQQAYIQKQRMEAGGERPLSVESVEQALDLAEERFPKTLVVSLNSKSDKRAAFDKPEQVFNALAWLATEYATARAEGLRIGGLPDAGCPGWFYTPHQSDVTMSQHSDWYETRYEGKVYRLANHIGQGAGSDPRNTIRIAFDWDKDAGRVLVGYIGKHQKTQTN